MESINFTKYTTELSFELVRIFQFTETTFGLVRENQLTELKNGSVRKYKGIRGEE